MLPPTDPLTTDKLPWRQWGLLLLLWACAVLLAGSTNHHDIVRLGWQGSRLAMIGLYGVVFAPNVLQSLVLAYLLARQPETMLRPRYLLRLLFALLLFLVGWVYFEMLMQQLFFQRPLPAWSVWLTLPRPTNWLVNGIFVGMVAMAQLAYAAWQRSHRQALAVQVAHQHKLAMRLALLQGQLEPYFLLASLDGIVNLVRDAERPLAVRALARLSDLLRHALRSSQQAGRLSVADEINFLRNYLDLQALRLGSQLQVRWQIDEHAWADYACPALLLYQLLEMAIQQSLQTAQASIALQLRFALQPPNMQICVAWNTSRASALPPAAWASIQERLALQFAERASLVYQQQGPALQIELKLPLELL